jgi:hypothetical protein
VTAAEIPATLAGLSVQFNADAPLQFLERACAETDAEKRSELAISAVQAMLAAWPGEAVIVRFRTLVRDKKLMGVGDFNDMVREARRSRKQEEKLSLTPGDIFWPCRADRAGAATFQAGIRRANAWRDPW